jgi:hypothetical protein
MRSPVVILLPVPIPEKNGDIECLRCILALSLQNSVYSSNFNSIHVNKPGALESATWHRQDPAGYEAAEKSLLTWAKTQFSEHLRLQ